MHSQQSLQRTAAFKDRSCKAADGDRSSASVSGKNAAEQGEEEAGRGFLLAAKLWQELLHTVNASKAEIAFEDAARSCNSL